MALAKHLVKGEKSDLPSSLGLSGGIRLPGGNENHDSRCDLSVANHTHKGGMNEEGEVGLKQRRPKLLYIRKSTAHSEHPFIGRFGG